jgi:acetolactate synthase I/II/III large subunit
VGPVNAAHLLVRCLEVEGVEHVFGIPGEETLDLNEALDGSWVTFVPVRHEQAGAFMADVWGRLTGRAGVCLGTLGPGATNLVTGVADAFLDRAPLVALTGQGNLDRMHKESHQYVDVMAMMRPITKWNARIADPSIVPEAVRKAFKIAEAEKPGATHLELPEGVMAAETDRTPLPTRVATAAIEPQTGDVARAAELICGAEHAVVLAGNGVVRGRATEALRAFAQRTGIGVAETFMGKGVVGFERDVALGAVGLQAGDYEVAGFGDADVVIAVGYDLVEHAPEHWNPHQDKRIVCIDSLPAETDAHFIPDVELVGDLSVSLARLTEACGHLDQQTESSPLCRAALGGLAHAASDDAFPMRPPRLLYELRNALGADDILVSDVGLHKLWIGRMYPAHEPNTVLIANGLAGMGFAVPGAIAAKLARPDAKVVAVSGDGGFVMNCQELETAMRIGTPFVNVVWENREFGSITWKQRRAFGRNFGTGFGNPDFVGLAESFGLPGWRVEQPQQFGEYLAKALELEVPSLIAVPVDYSVDVAIVPELGEETTST